MTVTILQVVPRLDSGGREALTRAGAKAIVATEGGHLTVAIVRAGGEVVFAPDGKQKPSHYGLERSPPQKFNL